MSNSSPMSITEEGQAYIDQLNKKTYEDYLAEYKEQYKSDRSYKIRDDYYHAYLTNSINSKMIMYEAFYGRGITCNPAALFYYLLKDPRFADYKHVWVLEKGDFRNRIMEKYEKYSNVVFVEPFTLKYYKYLSMAKYLINNVSYQYYFIKKPEQVVIHTWHGIPMKYLGYDTPNGNVEVANVIRNFMMADYLISPVPYMTEIFRSTYKLEGLYPGKIIETGYPRVDSTFHSDKKRMAKELKKYGVNYDPKKKLILYAPTFRGEDYATPDMQVKEYNGFIETISRYVDTDEYQILFKPHQIVYKSLVKNGYLQDNFIPAVVDTNELLGIVDILISDYSSIFFDYLVTGKPILFYITDLEKYKQERGLYLTPDDLPGPVSDDLEQIGKWTGDIEHYKDFFDYEKYEKCKEKYTANDDGHVCERVVNAVFFGDESHCVRFPADKKKLLFHLDRFINNGIASSLKTLVNNLDYETYDVTLFSSGDKAELFSYYSTIHPEVRIMTQAGKIVADTETMAKIAYCKDHPVTCKEDSKLYPEHFYLSEYKRCFGDAQFDYIIYFSGFSAHSANLYAAQKNTKKLIWMHSEVMKEYYRPVRGAFRFMVNMNSLMKLYPRYDACVSCSYHTMLQNEKALKEQGVRANWQYARNLYDPKTILKKKEELIKADLGDGEEYYMGTDFANESTFFVPLPKHDTVTFVTMGRLSKEKNQISLVQAFVKLHKEYPQTRLYLIGDGEISASIRNYVKKEGLQGKVILTGSLNNPFPVMSQCDCFVLPSFYEGMPMVLLEARTIGLPIIVSNFATVADSTFENGQLIVGTDPEEIYEGLKAFMEGKVPSEFELDTEAFNQEGIQEFEACLRNVDKIREGKR